MNICYNCFNEIPDGTGTCPHCGSSAELWNRDKYLYALPCGSVLNGKYIVGRVLGQGGFGITYVGQQYDTKQLVAIKEYYPGAIATRSASHSVFPFSKDRRGDYEYGKKQFLDEAKTLSAFIGSPNIVRIFGYFEENGTAYFVMEYVDGKSLRQYIADRRGRISWEETWSLLMPVLDALSEIHYRNIIHRDIKPDNIIITKSGSAKLIDFGAARYSQGEKSKSLTAVLTPGYAPLEQYFTRGRQGPWTDVYALAATIYYCITGTVPIESVERSVYDDLKKPSELGVSIPDYAEAALMKALAVKEQDRFKSTYDFRNALQKKGSAGRPNKILLAALIIAIIAVAVIVWPKGDSHSETETGTGGSDQQTTIINEDKEEEEPSPLAEDDIKEETTYGNTASHTENTSEDDTALTPDDPSEYGRLDIPNDVSPQISRTSDDPMALSDTWEEIIAACKDGTYKERYRLDDTKELDMGSEGIITMKLVAMDEDELADGSGKAPMTWVADELLKSKHNMNSEWTNEGGWEASEMRAWLRETVLPLMPEEVRNNIREVTKYSYSFEDQQGVASKETIWIPSVQEVFPAGHNVWTDSGREKEGVSYTKIFTDDEVRKRSRDGETSASWWWLRSASQYDSLSFYYVGSHSDSHGGLADSEGGAIVGFCLGEAVESSDSELVSRAPMELTDTWEEIAVAGRNGTYKERYRIGDTKELDMGSEGVITMKLVAMDEDELADGSGKAPMTWVADEILKTAHNMNTKCRNYGGWKASEMRAWLRETVLPLMPEDVRDNIREVTKYSFSYDIQKGVESKETIWIPSVREFFPVGYDRYSDRSREEEGASYTSVFTDDESRQRSRDGEPGASSWWLRSAGFDTDLNFSSVTGSGDRGISNADYEGCVVIGFCF